MAKGAKRGGKDKGNDSGEKYTDNSSYSVIESTARTRQTRQRGSSSNKKWVNKTSMGRNSSYITWIRQSNQRAQIRLNSLPTKRMK